MIYYIKAFGLRQGQSKKFVEWIHSFDFSDLPPGVAFHDCFLSWGDTAPYEVEIWFGVESWEMCDFLKESSVFGNFLTECSVYQDKSQPFRSWFFTTPRQGVIRESPW